MNSRDSGEDGVPGRGPSLWVVYGLMAVALLVAIGLAILVVLPFYLHRH